MLTQERKKKLVNNVFIKGQLSRKYPLVVFHKVEYDVVRNKKPYPVIKKKNLQYIASKLIIQLKLV